MRKSTHEQDVDQNQFAMNLDDLKELQRLLNHAIESMDAGTMFDMSEAEKVNHINAYGDNAAVIGDFVIRKGRRAPGWRNFTPTFTSPPPVIDSQAGDRLNPNSPHRQL